MCCVASQGCEFLAHKRTQLSFNVERLCVALFLRRSVEIMVKAKKSSAIDPVFHDDEVISPHDLSVADDSGWRDFFMEHGTFLLNECLSAQYNKTNVKQPIVFKDKMASDGKRKMLTGKHITWAVLESEKVYKAFEDGSEAIKANYPKAEFNEALIKAMAGIKCSVVEFPSQYDDPDWHFAYAVQIHDEGSNQFKKTSVCDMVENAKRFFRRTGTNKWEDMAPAGKRVTITQMSSECS